MQVSATKSNPSQAKQNAQPSSFAKSLFFGEIFWDRVSPFPEPSKNEQETLSLIQSSLDKLAQEVDPKRTDSEGKIPDEWVQKIRELGLFGMVIPEQYGGLQLSNYSYVQVMGALTVVDPAFVALLGAHQSIGLKALLLFGTEKQKQQYLPKLATGEMIAAFGLTEPGAGSDAQSIRTTAEPSADGSHFILNGNKIWITNGGCASFFTVFARMANPDPNAKPKITAFIVTRDMPGFSHGPEEKKMGLCGSSTTSLHFENVKVPRENVLGEVGHGFKVAMEVLNNGRLGLAGSCALGSKKLVQIALDHAIQRKQFGSSLASFDLIQSKLSNAFIDVCAAESMVAVTASLMDRGGCDYSLETAACKIFSTEMEWRVVNDAIQILGGAGYMKEYPLEKILRDSRIFTIWEGANDILRLFIGLSGLQAPGAQLKEISNALKQPLNDLLHSIGVLSDFGVKWIQRHVSSHDDLNEIKVELHDERKILEKYTGLFADKVTTVLVRSGKNIIKDQYSVKRIADILIDLFAMSCMLSKANSMKNKETNDSLELRITKAFFKKSRRRIAENIRRLGRNDDHLERSIAKDLCDRGGFTQFGQFQTW